MRRNKVKDSFPTAEQLRFADEHGASAGMKAPGDGGVFFYRVDGPWLNRWLVDARGNVRDEVQFRTHAAQPLGSIPTSGPSPQSHANVGEGLERAAE